MFKEIDLISTLDDLLVAIPPSTVELRDDRIKKRWATKVEKFFLLKFPVTQEIYQKVMKESPSVFNGDQ